MWKDKSAKTCGGVAKETADHTQHRRPTTIKGRKWWVNTETWELASGKKEKE